MTYLALGRMIGIKEFTIQSFPYFSFTSNVIGAAK